MNASYEQRLAISRLVHRFGFGPTPGEFVELLGQGVDATRARVLVHGVADPGLAGQAPLDLPLLGSFPPEGSAASTAFWNAIYKGQQDLVSWWLDRMYLADHPLVERMTWFWHGHWATAISKVTYPRPMQRQNDTLRTHALGSFRDMARAMVVDGALNYWLDNEENYVQSPNENLARELMELMTLGVGHYTQDDVTAAARALTGYWTNLFTGAVRFDPSQHHNGPVTILGRTGRFDALSLASLLVAEPDNARFIAQRLWFRFVSATTSPPASLAESFGGRDIARAVTALAGSSAWGDPANALVKAPVEWFVGACRALRVRPSSLKPGDTQWRLQQMGQIPFNPPNVGGWPSGQAWLTGVSLQYRFGLAQSLVEVGDLSPLEGPRGRVLEACADWLGVPGWSARTAEALTSAARSPSELAVAALLSPEYVVSL